MFITGKSFHGRVLDRIKIFSDAVFSIVLTLLILELKSPAHDTATAIVSHLSAASNSTIAAAKNSTTYAATNYNEQLGSKLLTMWPEYVSFTLSFALIGGFWKLHSLVFRGVERTERFLLYWNNLLLAFISLVPLASQILAKYHSLVVSAAAFNMLMAIIGIAVLVLFLECNLNGRLKHKDHKMSPIGLVTALMRIALRPVVHLIGFGVAFAQVYVSLAIVVVVPIFDLLFALNLDIFKELAKCVIRVFKSHVPTDNPDKK